MAKRMGHIRRFLWDRSGAATIEFVILFPALMVLFISSIELGILTLRNVMLERAVDLAVRDLRLGIGGTPSHDALKQSICERAHIINNCGDSMLLQLARVDTDTFALPAGAANCRDRTDTIEPVIDFTPGLPNDLMLVRACAIFDPIFPSAGLAMQMSLDASGGYAIVASSAFVVEPP